MNRIGWLLSLSLVLVLSSGCGGSNKGNSNPTSPSSGGNNGTPVLYIYATGSVSANAYQSFLNANGYNVTLATMATASAVNFSQYKAILIGSDTASSTPWSGATTGLPVSIVNSNKPVLGIGIGGACYFQTAGVTTIGFNITSNNPGVTVVQPLITSNNFWNSPNTISTTAPITMDSTVSLVAAEPYFATTAPSGTMLFGQDPNTPAYYPLAACETAADMNFLWALTDNPSTMTAAAKNLFLNALHWIQNFNPAALINYPNIGSGGNGLSDGIVINSYPGTGITGIVLWISANTAGTYTYTVNLNDTCWTGAAIASATSLPVTLDGTVTDNLPVTFTLPDTGMTKGRAVALTLSQASGPSASCYFSCVGNFGGLTGSSIGVNDMNGTGSSCTSVHTDGVAIEVYGNP